MDTERFELLKAIIELTTAVTSLIVVIKNKPKRPHNRKRRKSKKRK